jgi:D-lactate dehydrogenase
VHVAVFSTRPHDRQFLEPAAARARHALTFLEPRLTSGTVRLAEGFPVVCLFVNDRADAATIAALAEQGTRLITLRCAGFNNIDLPAAGRAGIRVARVPAYSPYAVAEHTVALILSLNRKIVRAHARVREGNFALDGLLGFDLHGRTVGIIGTGRIGTVLAGIMRGFGCRVLAQDPFPNPDVAGAGGEYVPLERLLAESDIVTLHCPLMPETQHLIDDRAIRLMKPGVMLINTSRGALIDTPAVIRALKSGHIAYMGLDVYEEEENLFFRDLSDRPIQDDVFARLLTFPNVVITGHQAFFTAEALRGIAETTVENVTAFEQGRELSNEVTVKVVRGAAQ